MGQFVRIMPSCSAEDFYILLVSNKMNNFLEVIIAHSLWCVEVKYVSKHTKRDKKVNGSLWLFL